MFTPYGKFTAWKYGGLPCPVCGFKGTLLHVDSCFMCGGSLIHCPRCQHITCQAAQAHDHCGALETVQPHYTCNITHVINQR